MKPDAAGGARYLVVHIDPMVMLHYIPTFDQLRFSLAYDPEDSEKVDAFRQLRQLMEQPIPSVFCADRESCLNLQQSW